MVFFQLNVTGLLFQSFRTASPANLKQPTKEIDNFITVNCECKCVAIQLVHRLLFIVHRIFFYLTNNSSLYFGSVHI